MKSKHYTDIEQIKINDMPFVPIPGVRYRLNPAMGIDIVRQGKIPERDVWRQYILKDLWFFVYFVMKWHKAHHPFIVNACNEIEEGQQTQTVDLWFREAGKSTIITVARSIQEVLRNPSERICIFSYAKHPAIAFLRSIKHILESSEFLQACFPDILYKNPSRDSFKWSEIEGLTVQRPGFYKEASFEAHGLLEGMPTGKHFSLLVYDDIVTADLVNTPEIMERLKEKFDVSLNIGTFDGRHRVIGTPYHHEDTLAYIQNKRGQNGESLYCVRMKPATVDGTINGESVYLPEERLSLLKTNRKQFYCQQLLDPTPQGEETLTFKYVKLINQCELPDNLYKFMVIDPSGSAGKQTQGRSSDDWACLVVGVKPEINDLGASDVFVIDGFIEMLNIDDALKRIVNMYLKHGRILKVGVEKIGAMTFEIHVANALRAKGKIVSQENGTLHILSPSGRKKTMRIEQNLIWPLNNGKLHISSSLPNAYVERIKLEMDKFPVWKDDGLDALAYAYDMIKEYRFAMDKLPDNAEDSYEFLRKIKKESSKYHWMTV